MHKIKLTADDLEAFELEKIHNHHQMCLSNEVERFKAQQTAELQALRKRLKTGREEQKKHRQLDLERLLQCYQNVKSGLESQAKFYTSPLRSRAPPHSSARTRRTWVLGRNIYVNYFLGAVASRVCVALFY